MGKRSNFERKDRDFYPTPYDALAPLLPYLKPRTKFSEPCAGNGQLVGLLENAGHTCAQKSDLEPQRSGIEKANALSLTAEDLKHSQEIITNPPWKRPILHKLLKHFRSLKKPVWFLLDADYKYTDQAIPYMTFCSQLVAVGRVSWMENGITGKDNCEWYRFEPRQQKFPPVFHPKKEKMKKRCPDTQDLFAGGGHITENKRKKPTKALKLTVEAN